MKIRILSVVIAATLAIGAVHAKEPARTPVAQTAQQQAARVEIDRLVERIKVLSKQLGEGSDVRVVVHKRTHTSMADIDDHDIVVERVDARGTPRKIHIDRAGDGADRVVRIERHPGDKREVRSGPGLGVVLSPNPAASGVRIAAVTPDSPAMKSGLRSGDVLLSVDGRAIAGNGSKALENARGLLDDLKQGQVVKLRYARQGKTYDASVKADAIRRSMVINRDLSGPMAAYPRMHGRGDEQRRHSRMLPQDVQMEIERMGPMHACAPGEDDCGLPALYQAFRWQGLNLAGLDASLGRYFGANKGVLVLSSGADLKGLQSGDVIRRVSGSEVDSPRDVMRALREKPSGSRLQFEVLRDRKATTVTVTVPKSRPLPFMTPPAPPAPPAPPSAPAPPTPPAAAMPPRPPHAAAPPTPPAPTSAPGLPRHTPRAVPPPPPPVAPAPPTPPAPPRDDDGAFAPEAMPADLIDSDYEFPIVKGEGFDEV